MQISLRSQRKQGGLGLVSMQYKAISLLIRNFTETSIHPKFQSNLYHKALYLWHVENKRDITQPQPCPYYDSDFFEVIKKVKEDGLLNIKTMTAAMWYRVLVEDNITHQETNLRTEPILSKIEEKNPQVDWVRTWSMSTTTGLSSKQLTFIWRMIHDLLPTQARLFRLKMSNTNSNTCNLCTQNSVDTLSHALVLCPYNGGAGSFVLEKLSDYVPNLTPQKLVLLDLDVSDDLHLPAVFLISSVLSEIWESRKYKKPCHLNSIRAALEAGINILRKSRFHKSARKLDMILA